MSTPLNSPTYTPANTPATTPQRAQSNTFREAPPAPRCVRGLSRQMSFLNPRRRLFADDELFQRPPSLLKEEKLQEECKKVEFVLVKTVEHWHCQKCARLVEFSTDEVKAKGFIPLCKDKCTGKFYELLKK